MGKVLIEKLLRSCSDLNRVFILIREKKSKSAAERLEDLKKIPVFDRLHTECPHTLPKMVAINGDVTAKGLGISAEDLALMANVSVIFHAAASVRFDDPLKEAILMNTRGTYELLRLAENLKEIRSIVHVSTTYCNPDIQTVEEEIYPPKADWRTAVKMAEQLDEEVINVMTAKFTRRSPNTYTFTKGLAEQVVAEYRHKLPLIIYRPSIVVSALDEPMPGWIDNFNGPTGLLIACSIGLLRTTCADPNVVSDFTPVDTSIKAMIVAAWRRGIAHQTDELPIYNCSTSLQRSFTTGFIVRMGETLSAEVPMNKMLWKPGGSITKCKYDNFIKVTVNWWRLWLCVWQGNHKFRINFHSLSFCNCWVPIWWTAFSNWLDASSCEWSNFRIFDFDSN